MTQFITSNLENHNQIQQTGFTANLDALFPWPPLMPKHREWHIRVYILDDTLLARLFKKLFFGGQYTSLATVTRRPLFTTVDFWSPLFTQTQVTLDVYCYVL
jgi:hypothetical protein